MALSQIFILGRKCSTRNNNTKDTGKEMASNKRNHAL